MNLHFLNFLADAPALAPGVDPSLQMWNSLITLGLPMVVIMYLFIFRPQNKKQKELLNRIAALKTGDRVVTVGGVHGVVSNIKDGPTLTLKVDDSCKLTVDKSAIVTVLPKDAVVAA